MVRGGWFFFYGTLTEDHDNPVTRAVLPLFDGGKRASVRGRLRAVRTAEGWYPVLRAGAGRVVGRVYRDRKSTRLNSSHIQKSRMPSSA